MAWNKTTMANQENGRTVGAERDATTIERVKEWQKIVRDMKECPRKRANAMWQIGVLGKTEQLKG